MSQKMRPRKKLLVHFYDARQLPRRGVIKTKIKIIKLSPFEVGKLSRELGYRVWDCDEFSRLVLFEKRNQSNYRGLEKNKPTKESLRVIANKILS